MFLGTVLNFIHLILLFSPVMLFFIPRFFIREYGFLFKFYFLVMILIPIHWVFLDDQCLFTLLTIDSGSLRNAETTSQFSEVYLKWLYKPIMESIGWKWDSKGLSKMVNLHWAFNFLLLWYFNFYFAPKELYC